MPVIMKRLRAVVAVWIAGLAAASVQAAPLFRETKRVAAGGTRADAATTPALMSEVNPSAVLALATGPAQTRVEGVPLSDGTTADFSVQSFEPRSQAGRYVEMLPDGSQRELPRPTTRHFRGRGISDPSVTLWLAVSTDGSARVRALVMPRGEAATSILPHVDKLSGTGSPARTLSAASGDPDRPAPLPHLVTSDVPQDAPAFCETDKLPPGGPGLARLQNRETRTVAAATVTTSPRLQLGIDLDVGDSLIQTAGSSSAAVEYVEDILAASSVIYERDLGVELVVSNMYVWTTPEPFAATLAESTFTTLNNYVAYCTANRTSSSRALSHYLFRTGKFAGIHYIDVLCDNSMGYGVSGLRGAYTYPTSQWTWDVNVLAHELGHGVASPHTHCYSPPIDKCYGGEGACYAGAHIPELGTLMSYCHLTNGQGKVGLEFHERCVEVMRLAAEEAACATAVPVRMSRFGVE